MPTPRINNRSIAHEIRFPHELANWLHGLASEQYGGNISKAVRHCVELAQDTATAKP